MNVQFPHAVTIHVVSSVYVVPQFVERYTFTVCPLRELPSSIVTVAVCPEKISSVSGFPISYAVPVNVYPESVRPTTLLVISGACITPSHPHHDAVIINPLNGKVN